MLDILKNTLATVAPSLGQAVGGPLGGAAANMIASGLGCKAEPKSIAQATPEQLLELKKAEKDFEVKMKELDVDIYKLQTQDVQNARSIFSGDWTSKILGFITIGGFMGYIFLVTIQPPEQNSEALINLVLGYLGGLASAVISFYFGASHKKDE